MTPKNSLKKRVLAWIFVFSGILSGVGIGLQPLFAEDDFNEKPEFYRYTHKDGTVVFTDDPEKIPMEYRKSSTPVSLPPLLTIPAHKSPPTAKGPSPIKQFKSWYGGLSPLSQLAIGGVFPVVMISLWAFYFLGAKTQNPAAKLILKLSMGLVIVGSVYLLYFIFMKTRAE